MNKHNTNYIRLSRDIFSDKYKDLTTSAKWLYCVLSNLEYKYKSDKNDLFFRSNNDLAIDAGLSEKTVRNAKKELIEAGLLEVIQVHFKDQDNNRSKKHISGYILH